MSSDLHKTASLFIWLSSSDVRFNHVEQSHSSAISSCHFRLYLFNLFEYFSDSWPQVCEEHHLAISATASSEEDEDGAECVLTFDVVLQNYEMHEFCEHMYPDVIHKVEYVDEKLVCTYS